MWFIIHSNSKFVYRCEIAQMFIDVHLCVQLIDDQLLILVVLPRRHSRIQVRAVAIEAQQDIN